MIEVKIKDGTAYEIGGLDYKIVFEEPVKTADSDENWGWWKNAPRIIQIHPECDSRRLTATLIHESLHSIDDTILGQRLTEQDIKNLEAGISQLLEQLGIRFVRDENTDN